MSMIFIHHHNDSEQEEKPPKRIIRIAQQLCREGGPAVVNQRGFLRADRLSQRLDHVRTSPADCGSDYWEFVIEDTDL